MSLVDDEAEWRRREAALMSYQVGEVLLMEYNGWLKAFKVVGARQVSESEIEYQLSMLELEQQWKRPE